MVSIISCAVKLISYYRNVFDWNMGKPQHFRMAQNPRKQSSRKQDQKTVKTPKWNNPDIFKMIEDAQNDLTGERTGDRAKFEVAFNDAERLYRAKVEFEFNPQQFEDFAADLGRPRSTAADLLKLHGRRNDGIEWFGAKPVIARGTRVNLSWQAYARGRKLILRATTKDRTDVTSNDETNYGAEDNEQAPTSNQDEQDQIAQLTKERDELKAKLMEVERERDEAKAELDRIRLHGASDA